PVEGSGWCHDLGAHDPTFGTGDLASVDRGGADRRTGLIGVGAEDRTERAVGRTFDRKLLARCVALTRGVPSLHENEMLWATEAGITVGVTPGIEWTLRIGGTAVLCRALVFGAIRTVSIRVDVAVLFIGGTVVRGEVDIAVIVFGAVWTVSVRVDVAVLVIVGCVRCRFARTASTGGGRVGLAGAGVDHLEVGDRRLRLIDDH